ncbi:hypothetical protein TanjilG_05561 [Lupinus angustifolius]|uniref:Uncharacterized protein n=1 Tax=Lupinus angustifolius TaxID=3871 RepID=A0A1J7I8I0_LUPAN|nr:hypothetical protein TanjilG_05561 [Lupinus angustifolius]
MLILRIPPMFSFLVSLSLNNVIAVLIADFHSLPSSQYRQDLDFESMAMNCTCPYYSALCKFLRTLATHTVNSGTKIQDCSLPVLVEYKMAEKLVMHVKADILQGDAMGDWLQKNSDLLQNSSVVLMNCLQLFENVVNEFFDEVTRGRSRASDLPMEYDGAYLQMRMAYSPVAHLFLFLVQWTHCHLAGALGLIRILIYKVYADGTTTVSIQERRASIREFYAVIYPSLMQLQKGVTDKEDNKQKAVCMERYRRRDDEDHRQYSNIDIEREDECGICMEMNSKIVLPNCNHGMCLKCYWEWRDNVKGHA